MWKSCAQQRRIDLLTTDFKIKGSISASIITASALLVMVYRMFNIVLDE